MPASDSHTEGRGEHRHGVAAALHVPRRGSRRAGTVGGFFEDGANAAGARTGGRQQRCCVQTARGLWD